nr:MAG TPA: hypothetical protein [Caudoviricetes sp.]
MIKIILPLRMMIQLESWYRVTECYFTGQQPQTRK